MSRNIIAPGKLSLSACITPNHNRKELSIFAPQSSPDVSNVHGLKSAIAQWLDADKAEDIEIIDLEGQTALTDFMIIASGRSSRQVIAIAHKLKERLASFGLSQLKIEGDSTGDWVIIDTGDVIVHLFRPEVREFYNIEQMWKLHASHENVSGQEIRA